MFTMTARLFWISTLAFAALAGAADEPYNEVIGSNGRPRPAYRAFQRRTLFDPLNPSAAVRNALVAHPMGDKNTMLPIPLVLSAREYARMTRGVIQSLWAQQLFFWDLVAGKQTCLSENGGFIPRALVERAFSEERWALPYLRELYAGSSLEFLGALYGPDLVRLSTGRWAPLEHNLGYLGGTGEIDFLFRAYRDAVLEHTGRDLLAGRPWEPHHLQDIARAFLEAQALAPSQVVALVYDTKDHAEDSPEERLYVDLEDARRALVMKTLGIEVAPASDAKQVAKLIERVEKGLVKGILNFVDPSDYTQLDRISRLSMKRGGLALLRSPGTDVLSSKALIPHVALMVSHYLKEDLLLVPPHTKVLTVDEAIALMDREDASDWVVKTAAGCQGSGVFMLSRKCPAERAALKEQFRSHQLECRLRGLPETLLVAQREVAPSVLAADRFASWLGYEINLRPIALAQGGRVHVSRAPWGRAMQRLGDGRANVSRGAFELVVMVEDSCPGHLAAAGR